MLKLASSTMFKPVNNHVQAVQLNHVQACQQAKTSCAFLRRVQLIFLNAWSIILCEPIALINYDYVDTADKTVIITQID